MEWILFAGATFAAGYLLALWRQGHTARRIERLVQAERERTRQIYTEAAKPGRRGRCFARMAAGSSI